jgi:hypothetical protein
MQRKCDDCGDWFRGGARFAVTHDEYGDQIVCGDCVDMYGGAGSTEAEPLNEAAQELHELYTNAPA